MTKCKLYTRTYTRRRAQAVVRSLKNYGWRTRISGKTHPGPKKVRSVRVYTCGKRR